MKLSMTNAVLNKMLSAISNVVERRHTMAVLSNFKFQLTHDRLTITASDLEVELVASMAISSGVCLEPGEVTISAKKLVDICKLLPASAQVLIEIGENQRCQLKAGSSKFVLGTLPAADFPLLTHSVDGFELTVAQAALKELLEKTAFAMAVQDVRYYLTGMLFEASDQLLRTVSTDGHRLALAETPAKFSQIAQNQAIVPRKAVFELQRLIQANDSEIKLVIGREFLTATIGIEEGESELSLKFTTKLIDGSFPDYRRVLPRHGDKLVTISQEQFKQTLQRVSVLSNEKLRGVIMKFDTDVVNVKANNAEQDEATEDLVVDYQGESLEVSFNAQYILDVLSVMTGERVLLKLSDPNASALLYDPENDACMYVVMPMRV